MEKEATCHCAICPLCDLRFPATSLLEANVGLSEHLRLGHPGLRGDDLIGAYIDAARIKAEGERCFPNVLEDRIPPPEASTGIEPPPGIQPEYLWREHRMYELIACINRHYESGFPVKPEWLEELRSILVKHTFAQAVSDALEPFRTNNPVSPKETR